MRSVTAVSLTGQQIPWVTYAIVNVPSVPSGTSMGLIGP
jgi:hypothetical protein